MKAVPRRIRGHISWQAVDARLISTRSMILSTTRPDGRPHALPTWFWWNNGRVYFITATTTQKARNLAGHRSVVAHFGDGDDVLFVDGLAAIVQDPHEQHAADGGYRSKYVDPVSGAQASVFDNPLDDLYRIDVERVVTWMYGTVGGWTEWRYDTSVDSPP